MKVFKEAIANVFTAIVKVYLSMILFTAGIASIAVAMFLISTVVGLIATGISLLVISFIIDGYMKTN